MILLALGLPGHFTEWCDAILVRLAGVRGQEVECRTWPPLSEMLNYNVVAPGLERLAGFLIGNSAEHVVIGARQPDDRLRQALTTGNTRFVLALDDPGKAALDLLAQNAAVPKMAVRAVANSCAMLTELEELPQALAVRAEHARGDPAGAVAAIAAHFGLSVGGDAITAILADLRHLWPNAGHDARADALPEPVARMIDGALLGYRHHFSNGRLDRIIWTRDIFNLADAPERSPSELIEIGGPNRFLTFGPFIHLPSGSWSAQVALGFSAEAAFASFKVDVYADGELASTTFQPAAAGIQNAELTFALTAPRGMGVEVRVVMETPHPAGRMGFGRVVLQPLTVQRKDVAEGSNDFARVLEL